MTRLEEGMREKGDVPALLKKLHRKRGRVGLSGGGKTETFRGGMTLVGGPSS